MALGLPHCFALPVPLLDDTYRLLAWGEDGTCKQMRHPRESHALELCEVLCTVAGPLSEHHFEIKATTEIIEHFSIIEERKTFIFIPVRNPRSWVLVTKILYLHPSLSRASLLDSEWPRAQESISNARTCQAEPCLSKDVCSRGRMGGGNTKGQNGKQDEAWRVSGQNETVYVPSRAQSSGCKCSPGT